MEIIEIDKKKFKISDNKKKRKLNIKSSLKDANKYLIL